MPGLFPSHHLLFAFSFKMLSIKVIQLNFFHISLTDLMKAKIHMPNFENFEMTLGVL